MIGKNKVVAAALLVLLFSAAFSSGAPAEQGNAESITMTLDRAVMPVTLYHPGLLWTEQKVVTLYDFVIRDRFGNPIDSFLVQKGSAQVNIPIETIKEIRQAGWICKNTKDIPQIKYVVPVVITLVDGREIDTKMNADFGTVEGISPFGLFFLRDSHTVRRLVFHR